ncbi:sialidase-1 [Kribbella amoyensis]|uniref:exo-alpha-sialidase n=1 Tax=Kribbella amoyensis TaxID=996641 RepID=A0A561B7Q3_9ACTN|nr:sialidase family protein [Kribbella amoyensis]TWD74863.1 sialidase-1 [Kribbella amoyensis]
MPRPRRLLFILLSTALLSAGLLAGSDQIPPASAAVTQTVLFNKGDAGYGCYRIPAIVRTTAGTLLAFAEARRTWCGDSQEIDLVLRRSEDDGRTWSAPQVVLSGTDDDPNAVATRGNPTPIVDQDTGRIVLLTTMDPGTVNRPRTPYVQYSDDDGKTFSKARDIGAQIDDPTWSWYATGPVHGIQLTRGAHKGRLVAGTNYGSPEGSGGQLVYSDDGGDTWHKGATDVRTDGMVPQEISVVEKVDGGIYAGARNNGATGGNSRAFAVSNDGGETFAAPFQTVTGLTSPTVQGSLLRLRATDQGAKYNRILFASPADPERRRYLTIRSSFTEGNTWQTVAEGTRITSDWSGYSDMTMLDTGEIGLLYEGGSVDARDQIRFARFTESDIGHPDAPLGAPTTPDVSGLANNAYLRGGTTSVAGKFGQARDLDGTDDAIQLPFAESLAVGAGDFTAMTWIKYGASTAPQAIFWGYGINEFSQFWLRAEPADARIRGLITTNGKTASVSSTKAYNDKAWHHVALQRKAGTLSLWVDGTQVGSSTAPAGSVSPARPFKMYVGQRLDGAHHFDGSLDEVRLYRRALSQAEITSIRTTNATNVPDVVLDLPLG